MKRIFRSGIGAGMRYVFAAGILVLMICGLAGVKFMQISTLIKFGEAAAAAGPPPEAVATTKATTDAWEGEITSVGSVEAVKGVTVSAEVPGVVKAIRYTSGAKVKAGQVLVELDSGVERAQLASAQARLDLAKTNAARSRRLLEGDAVTKAQLEADESQSKTLGADVDALRAQIARKTIRAPFAGVAGIRQVNVGQYLNPGTPVAVVESLGSVFVDFTVPQQRAGALTMGMPVRVRFADAAAKAFEGKVAALDPTVNETTRTLKARAEVPNAGGELRPGMFVNVTVLMPEQKQTLVTIPATAIVHAPYGDSVFIVEPKKADPKAADPKAGEPKAAAGAGGPPPLVARQQFVRVGVRRGDFVAIEDGVKAGEEVVTAGAFKLRNGAPVMVNDSVKLNPQINPQPENR